MMTTVVIPINAIHVLVGSDKNHVLVLSNKTHFLAYSDKNHVLICSYKNLELGTSVTICINAIPWRHRIIETKAKNDAIFFKRLAT